MLARSARLAAAGGLSLGLLACAGGPPSAPDEAPAPLPAVQGSRNASYESELRQRAQTQTQQRRLADAAVSWELLTVLRPEVDEYRERLADVRRHIELAVAEHARRAQQFQRRGELDRAASQHLAVLALKPDDEVAADALRAIERERNRRNYLGKYSRITLAKRLGSSPFMVAQPDDALTASPGRRSGAMR